MSVDLEAEKPAARVEKQEPLAWRPNRVDLPGASNSAETSAKPVGKPEAQPVTAIDKLAASSEPAKAPVAVEKPQAWPGVPATIPDSVLFHLVQPYELQSLTHLVRPVSLAVASATTGCALGLLPLVRSALDAVQDLSKVPTGGMLWYLIYAMVFALSAGISIIAWINTFYGRGDARRLMAHIRQRPKVPLSQLVNR